MRYYFIAISVLAVAICVYDKLAAIAHRRRVMESFLHTVSLFGGALAMYVTMLIIRHKTKHLSFMIPLPLMIAGHIALVIFLLNNYPQLI